MRKNEKQKDENQEKLKSKAENEKCKVKND